MPLAVTATDELTANVVALIVTSWHADPAVAAYSDWPSPLNAKPLKPGCGLGSTYCGGENSGVPIGNHSPLLGSAEFKSIAISVPALSAVVEESATTA